MSTPENPKEALNEDQSTGQEPESVETEDQESSPKRLTWMQDTLEWGAKAQPGKHGLTMRDINVGIYADVPEESPCFPGWALAPHCNVSYIQVSRPGEDS